MVDASQRKPSARQQLMRQKRELAERARRQADLTPDERLGMVICARLYSGCACASGNVVAVCVNMKFAAAAARRFIQNEGAI